MADQQLRDGVAPRVAHVITGLEVGGTENVLARLVACVADPASQLVLCLNAGGPLAAPIETAGVRVITLGLEPHRPSPASLWRGVSVLRAFRPSVLQTWMYHADLFGTVAAPLAGSPALIWNLRSADADLSLYAGSTGLARWMLARLSRFPAAVVANSRAGIESHRAAGYRPRRWSYIPNGVDLERFAPRVEAREELRCSLGIGDDVRLVGFVGRFDPAKNVPGLLSAFAFAHIRYPAARLLLVGPGMPAARPLVTRAGLDGVVFVRDACGDPERIYAGLDLFLLASHFEGFPNVVAEAMACGVPCVATEVGDCADIVGDTGLLAAAGNAEELGATLAEALGWSSHARAERGVAARRRIVARFGLASAARQYASLWAELAQT